MHRGAICITEFPPGTSQGSPTAGTPQMCCGLCDRSFPCDVSGGSGGLPRLAGKLMERFPTPGWRASGLVALPCHLWAQGAHMPTLGTSSGSPKKSALGHYAKVGGRSKVRDFDRGMLMLLLRSGGLPRPPTPTCQGGLEWSSGLAVPRGSWGRPAGPRTRPIGCLLAHNGEAFLHGSVPGIPRKMPTCLWFPGCCAGRSACSGGL